MKAFRNLGFFELIVLPLVLLILLFGIYFVSKVCLIGLDTGF